MVILRVVKALIHWLINEVNLFIPVMEEFQ